MRAVVMREQRLVVDTVPVPEPQPGEMLVKTLACGICGSDLHMLKHAAQMADAMRRTGAPMVMDPHRDIVMGHEFCAEIVEHGPGSPKMLPVGTRVCSMPLSLRPTGPITIGYSNDAPGGYGEYMVISEMLALAVPNGLSTRHAALTEPMAVGWHAVQKASLTADDVPLVVGCGPIGLAVIAALKIRGAAPIVAADFSAARRKLAEGMGADIVIDPKEKSPYTSWAEAALLPDAPTPPPGFELLMQPYRPGVIFECVGVPGVVQQILEGAPRGARIVVVGVCMEVDKFEPIFAINKELNVQFVLGYAPDEFAATLFHLAEGRIAADPLITATVGVEAVAQSFVDLGDPERHAKILVEPWR